jgi:hypothetical protein
MTALAEALALALIAVAVAITLWFTHAPAPSVHGDAKPDTSTTAFHVVRPAGAADGTVTVTDDQGRTVVGMHVRHNRVSFDKDGTGSGPGYTDADGTAHHFTTAFERDVYLSEWDLDLGTLAAYSTADAPHFQTGVRWGVCRLLYGTTALDAVALRDVAGAGISLYPPAEYCGDIWAHIGLGAWYVAPYRGGHPGFAYGLSFSTHE